jgi:hypothetical protein
MTRAHGSGGADTLLRSEQSREREGRARWRGRRLLGWCAQRRPRAMGAVMPTCWVAGTIVLLSVPCGSSMPTGPTITNIAGTWTGPLTDNTAGPGIVSLTVSQSGISLSGTWTITYQNAALNSALAMIGDKSGALSGSINGSGVAEVLTPTRAQACLYEVTATADGSSIAGTWVFNQGCLSPGSGNINGDEAMRPRSSSAPIRNIGPLRPPYPMARLRGRTCQLFGRLAVQVKNHRRPRCAIPVSSI